LKNAALTEVYARKVCPFILELIDCDKRACLKGAKVCSTLEQNSTPRWYTGTKLKANEASAARQRLSTGKRTCATSRRNSAITKKLVPVLGVDVILTILCRFRQSLPKKYLVLLKNERYDPKFAKTSTILNK
jgi:hypothetical protein